MSTNKKIDTIMKEVQDWMKIPGVEGVGQGLQNNKHCIIVFISRDPSELKEKIPVTYKGYPVKMEVSGNLEIQ